MTVLIAIVVRSVVLGIGIAAYYHVAPALLPDDDGLGTGLLAFLIIVVASGCWGLFDCVRREYAPVAVIWLTTSLLVAVGWWVVLAAVEADSSMSMAELLRVDAEGVAFMISLVAVPALCAGGLGQLISNARAS